MELLRRTTRQVELSEAGALALARATRALAEADALRSEVDDLRGLARGTLSVGMLPAIGQARAGVAARGLQRRLPGDRGPPGGGHAGRRRWRCCARPAGPRLRARGPRTRRARASRASSLFEEELAVIVSRAPPARPPPQRPLLPAGRRAARGLPAAARPCGSGSTPSSSAPASRGAPAFETNNISTVRALVSHGLGVSLVPRSFALARARRSPCCAWHRAAAGAGLDPLPRRSHAPPGRRGVPELVRDALTPGRAGPEKVRRSGPEGGGSP